MDASILREENKNEEKVRGKKIQEIVKMGKTATISNYFSKHSGSQKQYVKNYTEKKMGFFMQVC